MTALSIKLMIYLVIIFHRSVHHKTIASLKKSRIELDCTSFSSCVKFYINFTSTSLGHQDKKNADSCCGQCYYSPPCMQPLYHKLAQRSYHHLMSFSHFPSCMAAYLLWPSHSIMASGEVLNPAGSRNNLSIRLLGGLPLPWQRRLQQ